MTPALIILPTLDPLQVGCHEGVGRFQLLEPSGARFGAFAGAGSVALLGRLVLKLEVLGPGEGPPSGLRSLLLTDSPLDVGQGCWQGHAPSPVLVTVAEPFDPVTVRLLRGGLRPPIRNLVAADTSIRWAPPYLPRALDLGEGLAR